MTRTDYAERIRALLATAESTTHDAERETFTEAAERLMVKWGVDDAMLAADKGSTYAARIETRRYHVAGTSGALLAELVATRAAMGVGPVRAMFAPGQRYWWAVGHTDDLARVELYVPHIVTQARAAWKQHLVEVRIARGGYGPDRDAARVSFLEGFAYAIHQRLADMFKAETATTGGAELALRDRGQDVDDYAAQAHGDVKTTRPRESRSLRASAAGIRAGNEADLSAGALA